MKFALQSLIFVLPRKRKFQNPRNDFLFVDKVVSSPSFLLYRITLSEKYVKVDLLIRQSRNRRRGEKIVAMRSEICFTIPYLRSLEEKKISIPRDDFSFIKKSKFSFLLYKILTLSEKYIKVDRLFIRIISFNNPRIKDEGRK